LGALNASANVPKELLAPLKEDALPKDSATAPPKAKTASAPNGDKAPRGRQRGKTPKDKAVPIPR
jgi:hypothetical protein